MILKYSPFNTENEFFDKFGKIDAKSGTLVVVFNMFLNECGRPCLHIDKKDIFTKNIDEYQNDTRVLGVFYY